MNINTRNALQLEQLRQEYEYKEEKLYELRVRKVRRHVKEMLEDNN